MAAARTAGDTALALVAIAEGVVVLLLAIALLRGGEASAGPREDARAATIPADARPAAAATDRQPRSAPADDAARTPPSTAAPAAPTPATPSTTPSTPSTGAVLFGELVDARTGEPLQQARVRLFAGDDAKERMSTTLSRGASDYAIPGLEPGAYRLVATAAGHRDTELRLEIPPGVETTRADLRLVPTWRLVVRFVTPDGQPLREAAKDLLQAFAHSPVPTAIATAAAPPSSLPLSDLREVPFGVGAWTDNRSPFGRPRGGETLPADCDGALDLPTDDPYHVIAVVRSAVLATQRVEPGQPEVRLQVPLPALGSAFATVRLRLVDAAGAALPNVRVSISDAQTGSQGVPTGDDGRIEFKTLAPGLFELAVGWNQDLSIPPMLVEARPGVTLDLGDVVAQAPVACVVRLQNRPAEQKASLRTLPLDPPVHPATRPRALRHGEVEDEATLALPPGRYLVTASAGDLCGDAVVDTAGAGPFVLDLQPASALQIVPADHPVELELRDARGTARLSQWITWRQPYERRLPPGDYLAVVRELDGSAREVRLQLGAGPATLRLDDR
ncbi:MAG: carboxypeptidase-like regulatory domain-containing protein [Planctomycetota bacterium]